MKPATLHWIHELDMSWFWNDAEGDMGIRGLDPAKMLDRIGSGSPGFVDGLPERSVRAAGRFNRIMSAFSHVGHKQTRVLQRRYVIHDYGDIGIWFGELAGVVEYLSPDIADGEYGRGRTKPSEMLVSGLRRLAAEQLREAQAAYEIGTRKYAAEWVDPSARARRGI